VRNDAIAGRPRRHSEDRSGHSRPIYLSPAARIGDAWLIVNTSGLGRVMALMQTYRAALKDMAGHRWSSRSASNATSAHAIPLRMMNAEGRWNTNTTPMHHGDWRTARLKVRSRNSRDRFIIGDKASVKEEIARYRELLGVDHFIMRCQWPGLPQGKC
jgi:alkanesulfonate monooxygenase SsuD/methylene tetrahydromethanopterin reductase-like flavin-dependent oxidoreductase (luciferase family)